MRKLLMILVVVGGCSSSLVYSPGVHLQKDAVAHSVTASVGGGLLPETRPSIVDRVVTGGMEGRLGYAFTNTISADVRYFTNFDVFNLVPKHGVGIGLSVSVDSTDGHATRLILNAQSVLDRNSIEGFGAAVQLAYVLKLGDITHAYGAAGPVYGSRDFDRQWGIGALANVGIGVAVISNITCTLDVAGIAYYDAEDRYSRIIASPSILVTWRP